MHTRGASPPKELQEVLKAINPAVEGDVQGLWWRTSRAVIARCNSALDPVVAGEHLDRLLGVVPVGCIPDLRQGLARPGLHGLGQAAQHVGDLVDPVALVAGGWETSRPSLSASGEAATW
jgi:hypothetical protein